MVDHKHDLNHFDELAFNLAILKAAEYEKFLTPEQYEDYKSGKYIRDNYKPAPKKDPKSWGLDLSHQKIKEMHLRVSDWLNSGPKSSLVLSGPPGCGKSYLLKIAASYLPTCRFLDDTQLVRVIDTHPDEVDAYFSRILRTHTRFDSKGNPYKSAIILFDDLGVGDPRFVKNDEVYKSKFYHAMYQELFNCNPAEVKFLITTNLNREQLKSHLGPRGESRLSGFLEGRRSNFFSLYADDHDPSKAHEYAEIPDFRKVIKKDANL